jgi:hypothetical protein
LQEARRRNLRVVVEFSNFDRRGAEDRLIPLIRRYRDTIVAVQWDEPFYNGTELRSTPDEVASFGRTIKREIPGLQFWASFVAEPPVETRGLSIPDEVDVVVVESDRDFSPDRVHGRTDRSLPDWLKKARGRPILLRWLMWDWNPPGIAHRTQRGTMRACLDVARTYHLSGLLFDHYGPRYGTEYRGIDTNLALVREIQEVARETGFFAPARRTEDQGFRPLFNGRDLRGWIAMKTSPDGGTHQPGRGGWGVRRGELVCATDEPGWLKSNEIFGDFVLRLEYRLPPGGNSVVYIWSPGAGRLWETGMAITILDGRADRFRAFPANCRPGGIWGAIAPGASADRPAGQWNFVEVRCQGEKVEVHLNGARVVDADIRQSPALRDRPRSGFIGLSNMNGEAVGTTFRNIRIKPL